jgi:hypothetical protein
MAKPVFSHEDMMREIAARAELRLQTYEEDRSAQAPGPAAKPRPRAKPAPKTYRFH